MSNLIIRSENTKLEIPSSENLEITNGGLTLTLSFNGKGGFSLTQNGMAVASAPATPAQAPKPGTVMADGTVYAGISPDTGKAFYAAAQDVKNFFGLKRNMSWDKALNYAATSTAHGHEDWRVPTIGELNVLFNNRAAIGGLNESGSFPAGWYWSSSEFDIYGARLQRFSDGYQFSFSKTIGLSVRCVRG